MKQLIEMLIEEYHNKRDLEENMIEGTGNEVFDYVSNQFKRLPVKQFTQDQKLALEQEMKLKGKL